MLTGNLKGSSLLIGMNDFVGEIGSYYYGVVFKVGTQVFIKTANKTIAQEGSEFEIFMNEPPFTILGDITAYHLLVSAKAENMSTLSGVGAVHYLSLPSVFIISISLLEITLI